MNRNKKRKSDTLSAERRTLSAEQTENLKAFLDKAGEKHFENVVVSNYVDEPMAVRSSGLMETRGRVHGEETISRQFAVSGAGRSILIWQFENSHGPSPLFVEGFEVEVEALNELTTHEPDWEFEYDTVIPAEEQLHVLAAALACRGKGAARQIMWTYLRDGAPQAKGMSVGEYLDKHDKS